MMGEATSRSKAQSQTRYESSVIHRPCPRGCMGDIQITTTVGNGETVIHKECAVCGQFIGQTVLPVEQPERLIRVMTNLKGKQGQ